MWGVSERERDREERKKDWGGGGGVSQAILSFMRSLVLIPTYNCLVLNAISSSDVLIADLAFGFFLDGLVVSVCARIIAIVYMQMCVCICICVYA